MAVYYFNFRLMKCFTGKQEAAGVASVKRSPWKPRNNRDAGRRATGREVWADARQGAVHDLADRYRCADGLSLRESGPHGVGARS